MGRGGRNTLVFDQDLGLEGPSLDLLRATTLHGLTDSQPPQRWDYQK